MSDNIETMAPAYRSVDQLTGDVKRLTAESESWHRRYDDTAASLDHVRANERHLSDALAGVIAERDEFAADLARARADKEDLHTQLAAAVGFYDCPCGGAFELTHDSGLEDYAALNRWLGHHGDGCRSLLRAENERLANQLATANALRATERTPR